LFSFEQEINVKINTVNDKNFVFMILIIFIE
jgi:hypothetical protein